MDLLKIGPARLRIEAMRAGWRRDPVVVDTPDGPRIRWTRDGVSFLSADPDSLREPLRQMERAALIGFMSLRCPCCAQRAVWLTQDEFLRSDSRRVQAVTLHRVRDGEGQAAEAVWTIEHTGECPVRPAAMHWAGLAAWN